MSTECTLSVPNIIRKKRDKNELKDEEIQFLINKIIAPKPEDRMHDAQIGAFLMATFLNGLCQSETVSLVKAMTFSGFRFNWPASWKGTVVDKHSTGGVGDKVSLVLAPALAACGMRVPMISGRGLDFTGGTLDKLEAIPGFSVSLSKDRMTEVLESVGCCIVGQTSDIAPADKLLYAIRDTTATVDNEDLIVASIISKKASEGLDSLVLDVKTGKGAIMKTYDGAKSLAAKLVKAGNSFGMKVSAFITNMDNPLGNAVGNALEVGESIESLQAKGPSDLLELVVAFGGKLLHSVGKCASLEEGKQMMKKVIEDGSALEKFKEMMVSQGTPEHVAKELCYGDKWKHLPRSKNIITINAPISGILNTIDALEIAQICHRLGCGRIVPGGPVKFEPGVVLLKKPGDKIVAKEGMVEIHLPDNFTTLPFQEIEVVKLFRISETTKDKPLIIECVD